MKKIFIVAGELSGDKLGRWYVEKLRQENVDLTIEAVGGDFLEQAGATIYERFEKLNIVGLVEIIKHLRFILSFMTQLAKHITSNDFDEVVVIDFPGFNLRLIKKLKEINPNLKITYLSPPQLWVWGAWRLKKIKKYVDRLIVLYPFEVDWYKERGVVAEWLGYPFYDRLLPYFSSQQKTTAGEQKERFIAIMPGARKIEITRLLPLFCKIVQRFKLLYPHVNVILPLAESIDKSMVEKIIRHSGLSNGGQDITIITGEHEKLQALSRCCVALTKPGTVTLELGLLGIPSIIAYKASWLTYVIAKLLVNINSMSLPTLLLKEKVFSEFLQGDCKEEKILQELKRLYRDALRHGDDYQAIQERLSRLRTMLR